MIGPQGVEGDEHHVQGRRPGAQPEPSGDGEKSEARSYYDREKPGFMQQNARFVSALLYVIAILTSAALALRTRWVRSRRVRMTAFNTRLMEIAAAARVDTRVDQLLECKHQLMDILAEVVGELDREQVSQEEFEHFSFTWQAVDALVRDRLLMTNSLSVGGVESAA